ncbi:MAG: flagellar M-ring protein FliF [Candidatus Solibacter usitatus]|nr:flagellar M-ring protein FliF [Candidatus Solibacter usitatus]
MDQIKKLLATLPPKQRWTILFLAAAVGGGLFWFSRWQKERDFRPLYTSLAHEDAAAIVQKLRESGVEYRVADGGASVLVPAARSAELRLEMAGAGLPKSGRIGFELFDKNNFGATDFTEHVNFRRALEGELERSVMAMSEVEQARVHVTFAKESVFLETRQPAKASILVRLRQGAKLSPSGVLSITHLVSSAVEGLAPESVSVLDMRGNLLNRAKKTSPLDGNEPSEAGLEYQQKIERDLVSKINSTLEPMLGPDRFRAAVSVDYDFTTGEQSEETFDPSRSVMMSSQKTEDSNSAGTSGGTPGTAANLPRAAAPSKGSAGFSRHTENVTYQSSRTVRRLKLPQTGIKRLSASVLLDQEARWEKKNGKMEHVLTPPSPERMKVIRDLVSGVIGLKADRGDQLIVESVPFETTLNAEPPMEPSRQAPAPAPPRPFSLEALQKDPKTMAIGGVALVVVLALIVMLRMRAGRKRKAAQAAAQKALAAAQSQGPQPAGVHAGGASSQLAAPPHKVELLAAQLREGALKDSERYSGVLHEWLTEERVQ